MTTRTARLLFLGLALSFARSASPGTLEGTPVASGGGNAALDGWLACSRANPATAECRSLRSAAVDQLAGALRTLGGSGNFAPLPLLVGVLTRSPEPELRAAAADGVGMIGPTPAETAALAIAFNDPVPAVRQSARLALSSSGDPGANALATRAVRAESWKGFVPEREPDLSKLKLPLYAGATRLRFASDVERGTVLFASPDRPDAVVAFYAGKAKRPALSRDEFAAAYGDKPAAAEDDANGDDSGEGSGVEGVNEADLEQAMAMMDALNAQLDAGKSMEEAQKAMIDEASAKEVSTDAYADEAIYGAPRFVVLEESAMSGTKRPLRYVVVFRDNTLGKTGIALHAPPALP